MKNQGPLAGPPTMIQLNVEHEISKAEVDALANCISAAQCAEGCYDVGLQLPTPDEARASVRMPAELAERLLQSHLKLAAVAEHARRMFRGY